MEGKVLEEGSVWEASGEMDREALKVRNVGVSGSRQWSIARGKK